MSDVEGDYCGRERRQKEESSSDQPSSQSETEKAIVRTVTEVGSVLTNIRRLVVENWCKLSA